MPENVLLSEVKWLQSQPFSINSKASNGGNASSIYDHVSEEIDGVFRLGKVHTEPER